MTAGGRDTTAPDRCRLCDSERPKRRVFTKRNWAFVRCDVCGLVSLSPVPVETDIAGRQEESYQTGAYAAFAAATATRRRIARYRLELVRRHAGEGPWLDVGCSTGAFLAEATAEGIEAEGVELSLTAVQVARQEGLTAHHGGIESFRPTRAYGTVTAFDVIEHLREPRVLLDRVREWLATGGLLALTLPDIASLPARLLGRHWWYYTPPDHIHYFTPLTIRRLLERAGFTDVQVRPAYKPLTLEYAADALDPLSPGIAPLVHGLARVVPPALRARPVLVPIGEMFVVARTGPT